MKSFSFHLQKILDLKEKEKEQAQWELGKSVQKKNEEEAKLTDMSMRHAAVSASLIDIQSQRCSVASLMEITQYKQSIERAMNRQQQTIQGCVQEMENCKSRLTQRMQESQLWQRLKDRSKELFDEAQKQREQKELDEIGITCFVRQMKA